MTSKEQQVVDILTDNLYELCEVGTGYNEGMLSPNHKGIQSVAKVIVEVFQQPHKDTRSRREKQLDAAFERIGVKPRVYHFTERRVTRDVFNAVTVATIEMNYNDISIYIEKNTRFRILEQATSMIEEFKKMGVYGVSICDKSDVFSKQDGRNRAKGRLLQHLLKERKE